jgi:hypothetical protein
MIGEMTWRCGTYGVAKAKAERADVVSEGMGVSLNGNGRCSPVSRNSVSQWRIDS